MKGYQVLGAVPSSRGKPRCHTDSEARGGETGRELGGEWRVELPEGGSQRSEETVNGSEWERAGGAGKLERSMCARGRNIAAEGDAVVWGHGRGWLADQLAGAARLEEERGAAWSQSAEDEGRCSGAGELSTIEGKCELERGAAWARGCLRAGACPGTGDGAELLSP